MLRHTKVEVLLASAKWLSNFEMVRKSIVENIQAIKVMFKTLD